MPAPLLLASLDEFLDSLTAAKKSPHTIAAYRRDVHAVAELLVDSLNTEAAAIQLDQITVPFLRKAFALRAEMSSPATMARTHSAWTRFYRFLRSEGLVAVSPMDEIEKPRTGTSKPKSIETPDLAARLLAAAATPPPDGSRTRWPTRDRAIIGVFVTTGVRLAELVALNTSSITGEPGERQLHIVGKGSKYRSIPLHDRLHDTVRKYLEERSERFPDHDFQDRNVALFVQSTSGTRVTARQVQYLVERLYREAGVRGQVPTGALVHALRHTFAMDLLDNGASIIEVQTLLGHESLATTRRYLSARPHELRQAALSTSASRAV